MTQKEIWYETLHTGFGQYFSVGKVLYRDKTDHQDLVIFENPVLGRVMALDGVVQTTERDEFIYHEMLTHVPLLAHGGVAERYAEAFAGAMVFNLLAMGVALILLNRITRNSQKADLK